MRRHSTHFFLCEPAIQHDFNVSPQTNPVSLFITWSPTDYESLTTADSEALLEQIEGLAQSMSSQLERNENVELGLIRERGISSGNRGRGERRFQQVHLQYPASNAADAWRLAVTIRLLDLVHEALSANSIVSKRDLYYRDPALFVSQDTVNRYIEVIARTLCVRRSALNVTAAPKGLLSGPVVLHHRDGSVSDAERDAGLSLIPDLRDINSVALHKVHWILVIEKEATFRTCIELLAPRFNNSGGLLITAKGYPDQLSRDFVHMLSTPSSHNGYSCRPIYSLVDFDPDGFGIHSCYKYPTDASAQSIPIQLLGLTFDQLLTSTNEHAILALTPRDRTRATNMLRQDELTSEMGVRLDLQRMLFLGHKTELQHLSDIDGALLELLKHGITEWRE